MFGVHIDGWSYQILASNSPNELTYTHFTGNDRWSTAAIFRTLFPITNLTTWAAAFS